MVPRCVYTQMQQYVLILSYVYRVLATLTCTETVDRERSSLCHSSRCHVTL